jgi:hypothetical protein
VFYVRVKIGLILRERSLKVLENRLLKKVFVPKRLVYVKAEENCIKRILMISNDNHVLSVSSRKESLGGGNVE